MRLERVNGNNRIALTAWVMVATSAIALGPAAPAEATGTIPGFQIVDVFQGLDRPVAMEFAPDGRVFVAEKDGKLKVFDGLADSQPSQVFDWTTKINSNHDRGLLGLAIDPDFANGRNYVYLFYTYDALPGANNAPVHGDECPAWETTGCTVTAKLSRIEVGPNNTMIGPEHMLIEDQWCIQFNSHSNGDLEFGPDGYLYVSAGEGASYTFVDYGQNGGNPCHDPPYPGTPATANGEGGALRSQDLLTSTGGESKDPVWLSGAVLRIDPDTGAAAPGNPLSGGTVAGDDRIIAHGLRNPFRFAFRPGTNEIWLGDVGWFTWEEIDRIANVSDGVVENFGWPCYEGPGPHDGYAGLSMCNKIINNTLNPVVSTVKTTPYFTYNHGQTVAGCAPSSNSTSGIAFEDSSAYPADFDGAMFMADYSRGCIWVMKTGGGSGPPIPSLISTIVTDVRVTDLEIGPGGDLFMVDPNYFGNREGKIRRLRYLGANGAPAAKVSVTPLNGQAVTTNFQFSAAGSSDPDGQPLTYQWDFENDGTFDATGFTTSHKYPTAGTYPVRLRVLDPAGASGEATVVVNVSNTPPIATITAPVAGTTWRVGDALDFSGTGIDGEDGPLAANTPGREWEWTVILQHCPNACHEHVEATWTGIAGGSFPVPDHEYPSYLEFVLTVKDSSGATDTDRLNLHAESSTLRFVTSPPGFALTVGGSAVPAPAPLALPSLVGSQISVKAPSPQLKGGTTYVFGGWSDDGAARHDIIVPESDLTLTATFVPRPAAAPGVVDSVGRWHLPDPDGVVRTVFFGVAGDYPLVGDWDCDGIDTPGLYRQSTGLTYLRNTNTTGIADVSFIFGIPGDIPIAGDFNGDGCDTISVYRNGHVYIINELGADGGSLGAAESDYWFGIPGDTPFVGDFNGDGIDELGLFRQSTGFVYFTLQHPTSGAAVTANQFFYGIPGDRIITGDWTNNGIDTVGIYRPSNNTFYLRYTNTQGTADETITAPVGAWPVAGAFIIPD